MRIVRRGITSLFTKLQRCFYSVPYVEGDHGTLEVGERCSLVNTLVNLEGGSVTIGDYTIFGYNVMLLTGTHEFHNGQRVTMHLEQNLGQWPGNGAEVPRENRDIVIGRGSYIGSGAIVLGGVTLGSGVIVGAGSVVTKDVADFAIVAGVPCRQIGDTRDKKSSLAGP